MPQDLFHRRFPQSALVLLLPKVIFLPVAGDEKWRGLQVLNILVPTVSYHFTEVDCIILMEMMIKRMVIITGGNDEDGGWRGGGIMKKRATDEADQGWYGIGGRIRGRSC